MNTFLKSYFCNVAIYAMCITAVKSYEQNNTTTTMVEESGCPFRNTDQFLSRDVCLLPNYDNNRMPDDTSGKTQINITLLNALVLEIDEKKNRLTLKLSQFLKWFDPRIKLSKSAIPDEIGIVWLPRKNIDDIWHPDLEMYTENLEEWTALHEPNVYSKLVILTNPSFNHSKYSKENPGSNTKKKEKSRNHIIPGNKTQLGALKAWKPTLRCVFDFSSYPFDIQHCTFLQFGDHGMQLFLNSGGNRIEWKQETDGFQIEIVDVGSLGNGSIGFNLILKRIVEPFIYRYYLPCIAIVIVSLVSFLIPLSAIPGRVGLVVTQFLTLTNIFIHQIVSKRATYFSFKLIYSH